MPTCFRTKTKLPADVGWSNGSIRGRAQRLVSGTGLVGAFRSNDPIIIPCGFSGRKMPAKASPGHEPESKQVLEAQLQATLGVIPAYTWYANPSGALTFVNKRHADYLGLPKDDRRSIPRRDRTRSLR